MRKLIALSLLLGLALSPPAGAATVPPIDPLTYTVVRTPPALQVEFPPLDRDSSVVIDQVKPFPDRRVPPVFWFEGEGLRFGLVRQDRPAPLVFLIAGTGASFDSDTNRLLARALHRAGMHVLGLPSPTHPNFIVNASATGVPGRMEDDARDLYRAMRLAYDRIKDRIEVTDFRLTGYSLGATNAAWVARHDEGEQAFRFRKVLLLNPSVSLFNSVQILDGMYDRYVGDDPESAQRIIDRVFAAFADVYTREQGTNFDGEFLYHAYQQMRPGPEALETLIGTSFRFSAANMAFASDATSRGGYMLARGRRSRRRGLAYQHIQACDPSQLQRLHRWLIPALLPGARPVLHEGAGDRRCWAAPHRDLSAQHAEDHTDHEPGRHHPRTDGTRLAPPGLP